MKAPEEVLAFDAHSGTKDTSSKLIPRDKDTGAVAVDPNTGRAYDRVAVATTMTEADAKNPANSCRIVVLASWDGGKTFKEVGDPYVWQGGVSPRDGSFTFPYQTVPIPVDDSGAPAGDVRYRIDTKGKTLSLQGLIGFLTPGEG